MKTTNIDFFHPKRLESLILLYGAGTLAAQVLILREVLVLAQGVELKLALALWGWLFWTGLGALLGGWRVKLSSGHQPPAARCKGGRTHGNPLQARLSAILTLLGLLLAATLFALRSLPRLGLLPLGQSLGLLPFFLTLLVLLAPFCLVSGYFFPAAVQLVTLQCRSSAAGRIYRLEALGAALGVLLLQIFLLGRLPDLSLALGLGLILSLAAWLQTRSPRSAAAVVLLGLAMVAAEPLERVSRGWQWPGRQLLATVDSPYALLTATREAEQISFFANGLWQFTYPDPFSAEQAVQLALLQHPHPRQVLLLGGGLPELGEEILKTASVTRLDYVELDPDLVHLAQTLLPAGRSWSRDPRVRIIYRDARAFLASTPDRYDVILMALPEPRTAQMNRFYTQEFFELAASRLNPGGVFSFALPGSATSLHPLRAAYLALAYNTAKDVFPQVLAYPGEQVRFFATVTLGTLVDDPRVLMQRLRQRGLKLKYIREYYLLQDLSAANIAYLARMLTQPPAAVNTDLGPGCYFFDLALSTGPEGTGFKEALVWLRSLPPYIPWLALALVLALAGVICRRRPGSRYLFQVAAMGLGTFSLEILVLILYQISLGSLYRQLGLLTAAFMAGMAAGGALAGRLAARTRLQERGLLTAQIGLAVLAIVLALAVSRPGWLSLGPLAGPGYALVLTAAGLGGGYIFALAAALWAAGQGDVRRQGGLLYAADLFGATLGTLGLILIVLPIWGLLPALYLIAVLHSVAALVLLARR